MTDKNHPNPSDVEFTNGDFTRLKELIMWRLDRSDAERAELSERLDRNRDTLSEKIDALTVEVRTKNAEHELAYGLLKLKVAGISAISAIVSSAITGAVTAYEFLKRWRP